MNNSDIRQPEDELQYIRKIIEESRAAFVENGKIYILWGLIMAIGMGVTYLSFLLNRNLDTGYVWIALILLGWIMMIMLYRARKHKGQRAKSIIERIDTAIWGACGGAIGLLVIIFMLNYHYDPSSSFFSTLFDTISPFVISFFSAIILGIAFYLSGIVNQIRWLRNLSFVCWAGAAAMFLWPSIHVFGLYALMLILFQVVPGIILQRRYHRITIAS